MMGRVMSCLSNEKITISYSTTLMSDATKMIHCKKSECEMGCNCQNDIKKYCAN